MPTRFVTSSDESYLGRLKIRKRRFDSPQDSIRSRMSATFSISTISTDVLNGNKPLERQELEPMTLHIVGILS
jgi:hypothetical protein